MPRTSRPASRCAALGALLLLSQRALARRKRRPARRTPAPHEWEVVSTASRKMLEVQRETDACVVERGPVVLRAHRLAYRTVLSEASRTAHQ